MLKLSQVINNAQQTPYTSIMINRKNIAFLVMLWLIPVLSFAKPVERIISLDMCSDWMLVKYADRSQILALSSFIHQYPVDWIGDDWPTHDGNLETILSLKPDLVLTGEFNAWLLRERLKKIGLKVVVLPLPNNLKEIVKYEEMFLSAIGLDKSRATQPVPVITQKEKPQKLLILGANAIGTGRGTFQDDLIRHAGWENYLDGKGYITLDLEQLVLNKPDAILWAAPRSSALANQFAEHPVLKTVVPNDQWLDSNYWNWQCPGPWTWELVTKMDVWKKH